MPRIATCDQLVNIVDLNVLCPNHARAAPTGPEFFAQGVCKAGRKLLQDQDVLKRLCREQVAHGGTAIRAAHHMSMRTQKIVHNGKPFDVTCDREHFCRRSPPRDQATQFDVSCCPNGFSLMSESDA